MFTVTLYVGLGTAVDLTVILHVYSHCVRGLFSSLEENLVIRSFYESHSFLQRFKSDINITYSHNLKVFSIFIVVVPKFIYDICFTPIRERLFFPIKRISSDNWVF